MSYFRSKKHCWDLIKKHYPSYESKRPVIEAMIRQYLKKDLTLVDVGCGRGLETVIAYKDAVNVSIGVDVSVAIKDNNTVDFRVRGSAEMIPLASNSVDLVISQELIEHLKNPEDFFAEAARILKPGGHFILATPNLLSWKSFISCITPYSLHVRLNKQLHNIDGTDVFPTFYRMNTLKRMNKCMTSNGMSLQQATMWEGTPRTLTFNIATTYLELLVTAALKKYGFLKNLRELIVVCYRKDRLA